MEKIQADEKRRTTSMNIALTAEDKKFIKIYALENDTTVADVIHEYIQRLREGKKE